METLEQLANDLADAYRKRAIEQVAGAGFLMGLESNNIPVREELVKPYTDALNQANQNLWRLLWKAYDLAYILHGPGAVPKIKYNSNRKCTTACKNAKRMECECSCFGFNHSMNRLHI